MDFAAALAQCPLIAILQGHPAGRGGGGGRGARRRCGACPHRSPAEFDPTRCAASLFWPVRWATGRLLVRGLSCRAARWPDVAAAGGRLVVSPNTDPAVIAATVEAGLASVPGFLTPSESVRGACGRGPTAC